MFAYLATRFKRLKHRVLCCDSGVEVIGVGVAIGYAFGPGSESLLGGRSMVWVFVAISLCLLLMNSQRKQYNLTRSSQGS